AERIRVTSAIPPSLPRAGGAGDRKTPRACGTRASGPSAGAGRSPTVVPLGDGDPPPGADGRPIPGDVGAPPRAPACRRLAHADETGARLKGGKTKHPGRRSPGVSL